MGQTRTSKYVYEVKQFNSAARLVFTTPVCWKGKLPTVDQLERRVMCDVVSTYPGYVNEHIGRAYGIAIPSAARIRENKREGKVLVEWTAPMFTVLPNAADYPEVAKKEALR